MLDLTRRNALLTAAVAGAAFGLPKPVSFIEAALAQKGPEAGKGFRPFNRSGPGVHPERRRLGETSRSLVYQGCVR